MARIPSAGGAGSGEATAFGWVKVADISTPAPGGVVSEKVFNDAPNNTILSSCRTSDLEVDVLVRSSFPAVNVAGGTPFCPSRLIAGIIRGRSTSL